jgi:hypothetical protein
MNIYGGGNNTVIQNNTFIGLDSGSGNDDGIFLAQYVNSPNIGGTITIRNNLFTGANSTSSLAAGMFVQPDSFQATSGLPTLNLVISNNTINMSNSTNSGGTAIIVDNGNGGPSLFNCTLNDNQIFLPSDSSFTGVSITQDTGAVGSLIAILNDNVVQPSPPALGYSFSNNSSNPGSLQVYLRPSNVGTRSGP